MATGNFTQTDYVLNTLNGHKQLPRPAQLIPRTDSRPHESGTYHVNADCTGNLEIHFAPATRFPEAVGAVSQAIFGDWQPGETRFAWWSFL